MAGLAVSIPFVAIFIIFLPTLNFGNDIASTNYPQITDAIKQSPVVTAFFDEYPDASIIIQQEEGGSDGKNAVLHMVEVYKEVEWTAYYNSTTGRIINEDNVPIDNAAVASGLQDSHKAKITNTMRLLVQLSQSGDADGRESPGAVVVPLWLHCSTESFPGSGMTAELVRNDVDYGSSNNDSKYYENRMIQLIKQGVCFPSHLPSE
ncbi:MAG TPA: hypothetical protein VJP79_00305 [Nitrososphaera sp.]|nr:hypothetical protein [Nitrososphaera sp.]